MTESPHPQGRRSLAERIPNSYVLILGLLFVTAALTWVVPPGQFARVERDGRTVVVPGTYQRIDAGQPLPQGSTTHPKPQGILEVLRAPLQGFVQAADIIVFILVIGGAFKVLEATGAVRAAIGRITAGFRGREILLIPIVMVVFSLAGAVFGMSEETIPFVMLFVPLALALGYDSITGIAMPFVAASAGFSAAFINPFTLGIAQGIAGLPPLSGIGYRLVVWAVCTAIAIIFVTRHALRVRRDPALSPTYAADEARRAAEGLGSVGAKAWQALDTGMTRTHRLVLTLFGATIALLIVGVLRWGWYIEEIGALFLGFGVLAALAARMSGDAAVGAFLGGAAELVSAALIVGLARGVLVVAQAGGIIDPALYLLSSGMAALPPVVTAQVMFLTQAALNLVIPSSSGMAALSMPLMSPLADLVGVTRQTAVLAYQFGDGFTNMIIPTSGVLLGVLGAARVSWVTWARWMLPLQILFVIAGLLLLIPPVLTGWGPH